MIEPTWKRIVGVHGEDNGTVGAVWLAYDPDTGVARVYDAAKFNDAVPVVMNEGIAARGRNIPLAWRNKDKALVSSFEEAGLNVLPDPIMESESIREIDSRTINQMLLSSRLRVERRVGSWLKEYRDFRKQAGKVPEEGFPLMAATRHAIRMLSWALPERSQYISKKRSPGIKVMV